MAALERKQVRLNGYVSADTDQALFDAMTGVSPYKRMALLRRLANVGLMVEQGRLEPRSQVAPSATETLTAVAVPKAPAAARKAEPTPPSTRAGAEAKSPVSDRVVTARSEKRSDGDVTANDKPRAPNLALMGRMNLSIME